MLVLQLLSELWFWCKHCVCLLQQLVGCWDGCKLWLLLPSCCCCCPCYYQLLPPRLLCTWCAGLLGSGQVVAMH